MKLEDKLWLLGKLNAGYGHTFNYCFMKNVSKVNPESLTEKQLIWIDKLLYTYRRQFVKNKEMIKLPEDKFISYMNKHLKRV